MRLRKSLTTLGTAAVLAGTIGLLPGAMSAHAAPSAGSVAAAAVKPVDGAIPVTGTLANGTAFTGQLSTLSTSVDRRLDRRVQQGRPRDRHHPGR